MDKNSQMLVIGFAILLTLSVVMIFYRYIVKEDIKYYLDDEAFEASLLEE
jgi:hypothetical protein